MYEYYTTRDPDIVTIQGSHGFQGSGIPVLGFNEPKFALNRVSYGNKMALLGRSQVRVTFNNQRVLQEKGQEGEGEGGSVLDTLPLITFL